MQRAALPIACPGDQLHGGSNRAFGHGGTSSENLHQYSITYNNVSTAPKCLKIMAFLGTIMAGKAEII